MPILLAWTLNVSLLNGSLVEMGGLGGGIQFVGIQSMFCTKNKSKWSMVPAELSMLHMKEARGTGCIFLHILYLFIYFLRRHNKSSYMVCEYRCSAVDVVHTALDQIR